MPFRFQPLTTPEGMVGVLGVTWVTGRDGFSAEQERSLVAIVGQTAIVPERAKLVGEAVKTAALAENDCICGTVGLLRIEAGAMMAGRDWVDAADTIRAASERRREALPDLDIGLSIAPQPARRHVDRRSYEIIRIDRGPLSISIEKRLVICAAAGTYLTPKEYGRFILLGRHVGKGITHKQILAAAWSPAHRDDTQCLRVFIGQCVPR